MATLEAPKNDGMFVKLNEVGDKLKGIFQSYGPGKFGPELTVRNRDGIKVLGCTSHLVKTIEANRDKFVKDKTLVEVELKEKKDVGKAYPMKLYKVDVEEWTGGKAAPEPEPEPEDDADEDRLPF